MGSETDLIKLYSGQILALAADIPHHEQLKAPDATVRKRAPLCGSTVTVGVTVRDGKVAEFGQSVKACALGQAAAAVVGGAVKGLTLAEIESGHDALRAMLTEGAEPPQGVWSDFAVLQPAQNFRNRHASILLSIEATAEAVRTALDPAQSGAN